MSKSKSEKEIVFDWDEANITHIARHDVSPEEAEAVFFDRNQIVAADVKHSTLEQRSIIIGKTEKGRILYQVYHSHLGMQRV